MAASDYVRAVVDALNRKHAGHAHVGGSLQHEVSALVTVLFYPEGVEASIPVDRDVLESLGVQLVAVPSVRDESGSVLYDAQGVVDALSRVLLEAQSTSNAGAG